MAPMPLALLPAHYYLTHSLTSTIASLVHPFVCSRAQCTQRKPTGLSAASIPRQHLRSRGNMSSARWRTYEVGACLSLGFPDRVVAIQTGPCSWTVTQSTRPTAPRAKTDLCCNLRECTVPVAPRVCRLPLRRALFFSNPVTNARRDCCLHPPPPSDTASRPPMSTPCRIPPARTSRY